MHECLFLVCTLNKIKMDCKEQILWTYCAPVLSAVRLWESSSTQGCFQLKPSWAALTERTLFWFSPRTPLNSMLPPSAFMEVYSPYQWHQSSFHSCEKSRWASEQQGLHFAKGGSRCHHQDHASGDGSTGGWCRLLSPAIKERRIATFKQDAVKKRIKYRSLHILDVFNYLLK